MIIVSEKCDYIRYSPALFSNCKLTTPSGKHLENISHAHIVSLMNKLLISKDCKDSDELLLQEKYAGNNSDLIIIQK